MSTTGDVIGSNQPISQTTPNETDTLEVQIKCKKPSKPASDVWAHYTKRKIKNGDIRAFCNCCNSNYAWTTANGTTTLRKHVMEKCKKSLVYKVAEPIRGQQTLTFRTREKSGSEVGLVSWKYDHDLSREAFVRMIILDELPFKFTERVGFRQFMSVVQPKFRPISSTTLVRDAFKIYANEKNKLKNCLVKAEARVCLTTDLWTSIQNLSYLCLTIHFIDTEWRLHKKVINFCLISSHKRKEIGRVIESCLFDWGIDNVGTITVDNASANDVAIEYLRSKLLKKNGLILNGEYFHTRCCAHILNLIVKDGISEMQDSISRIRAEIKYVRSSPSRSQQFQACIAQEKNTSKSSLCLDVSTRWNSTYLMLETVLKFQKAFERMEEEESTFVSELTLGPLTEEDWKSAHVLTRFLKRFFDATKRLSGTLYVTANVYFHEVFKIETLLIEWSGSSDSYIRSMAVRMKEKFDRYWGSSDRVNMLLMVAILLDPRYKLKYVKFCYSKVFTVERASRLVNKIMNVVNDLYDHYKILHSTSKTFDVEHIGRDPIYENEKDEYGLDIGFENEFQKHLQEEEKKESITELDRYFGESCEKDDSNFDILQWWKVYSSNYEILSKVARDVLAIPVSTVFSESTFNTGGRILDQFRSSLTPKLVECLICSQDWLKSPLSWVDVEEKFEELEELENLACQVTPVDGSDNISQVS